jgi:hypothetical protein
MRFSNLHEEVKISNETSKIYIVHVQIRHADYMIIKFIYVAIIMVKLTLLDRRGPPIILINVLSLKDTR